ncbi:MAG: S8 family serine peptidase [Bacteroidota bacterium]
MKRLLTRFLVLTIFSSIAIASLSAQELKHVQGELLVRFEEETPVRSWVYVHQTFNSKLTQLKVRKLVAAPLNIYALTFDWQNIDEHAFLQDVRKQAGVVEAQFNHLLELRAIPDDPQFDNQWQYINTGQSGGTPGADIDMDLAWDITTGGLTPDGDTIVVCVIDDVFQISHVDLADNVWINHAEIPDNGIDDDNNGFIDDYRGWNTGDDDDNISTGNNSSHGTAVAGIVGAKGNNGIGVAGVNWDVKLMLVAGGTGIESEVLEAYSYPLGFRQKYNETNGEEGAFVVATNASWGVNFGQPANAPLWCAFYDTLGVHGILNAGATINGNQNVDEVGDLPTACSSDYLVAVTNMNDDDEKVTGAGFGAINIDIGAFGAGTWTTRRNNDYGGFGGTSGATPHVAGTIALLYAAPCPDFIALAKANPGAAALAAKQYILDGGDDNASLDGITLTGKRLNAYNSLQLLLGECGPCPDPRGLFVTEVIDTSAGLNWVSTENTISDTLRWRAVGSEDWNVVLNASSPLTIDTLMACTDYEFQVISNCDTIVSDYSSIFQFTTDGCCINPEEYAFSGITDSTATLSWNRVIAAQSYDVQIRAIGDTIWTMFSVDTAQIDFFDLMDCTNYEVQVQTICANDTIGFGPSQLFSTMGCGPCFDLPYCDAPSLDSDEEWINIFGLSQVNSSGNDGGYGDFTGDEPALLSTFNTFNFALFPGYADEIYEEQIRIWIDLNQDGTFDDDTELMYSINQITDNVVGTITIPGTATLGVTRMRVIMTFATEFGACTVSNLAAFGEVEDYCVEIIQGIPPCEIPLNLDTTSVTESSAIMQWDADPSFTSYELRYKLLTESDWTALVLDTNSYTIDSLSDCSDYEAQVRSICTENESDFSESFLFRTTCITSTENRFDPITDLFIAPNPFSDQFRVRFTLNTGAEAVEVDLLNYLGQQLQSQTLPARAAFNEVQFDGSQLPNGVYFVRFRTADGTVLTEKVVKAF